MIRVENLTKRYGRKEVLRGITFTAAPGAVTLLVGPNGAGKSTTMKILSGLIRGDAGHASVQGLDLFSNRLAAQRALAFLPQSPSFHPRLTCHEIIAFYARLRSVPASRALEMLELAGLADLSRVRTGALSGGMRQRLALALLFLPNAPVLLLDEPGLSLDPSWRKRLQELLQSEAEHGKTVLITTHLVAEWNAAADRCLLCREGRIAGELDPFNLPRDFETTQPPASSGAPDEKHVVVTS